MQKRNRKKNENEVKGIEYSQSYLDDTCKSVALQLGKIISGRKRELKLSRRALTRMTGVSAAKLEEIESGKSLPRFQTLLNLVIALDIPLNRIFGKRLIPVGSENVSLQEYFNEIKNRKNNMEDIRSALIGEGLSETETNEVIGFVEYKIATRK